jgi:hypothetical protein
MSSLFSKPKAPDTSKQTEALERQKREADERRASEEQKIEEREARLRRSARGRRGLIRTSATGVSDDTTGTA